MWQEARITELEEQVRLLAAGLNLEVRDPGSVIPEHVIAVAQGGELVAAVKLLRALAAPPRPIGQRNRSIVAWLNEQSSGMTLLGAKRVVDAAVLPDSSPRR